ncbi:DUF3021 domain-containing protein [Gracilibacillus sp. YIM 98692]|uniref:DUF3021 domain-containing protein n=1 Tax=Gracilibacillus sp. YIM 98692 TaxID=2663532 RepID=UPI0013CFCDE9|nr:DUF3021 domain-containing protein [Gracilibacillus sp. YIM 98692]
MKKFLIKSMIGIMFGAFVSVMVTNGIILIGGTEVLDGGLFLKNSLGSMFCGWFFTVTPLYFEINSISLFKQTALHFITVTILYFILALGIGWIPLDWQSIVIFTILFLLVYISIWLSFYLYYKKESKKMNEDLQYIQK